MICHFDWLPLPGSIPEATESLILAHNPKWGGAGGSGMYPQWAADVSGAGSTGIETFSYDVQVPYTHEAWRGRIRASAGVAACLPADAVQTFDQEHAAMLAERFPDDPLGLPHRVWALVAGRLRVNVQTLCVARRWCARGPRLAPSPYCNGIIVVVQASATQCRLLGRKQPLFWTPGGRTALHL